MNISKLANDLYVSIIPRTKNLAKFQLLDDYHHSIESGFLFSIRPDGYLGHADINSYKGLDLDKFLSLKIVGIDEI